MNIGASFVDPRDLRNKFLQWAKVKFSKLDAKKREAKLRSHYGRSALTLASQWHDLCHKAIDGKPILTKKEKDRGLKEFAMAHRLLWTYPKNATVLGDNYDKNIKYSCGKHLWTWIKCIANLDEFVIFYPEDLDSEDSEVLSLSIDGVDKKTWERKHPTLPKDKKNFTKKHAACGVKYQIVLCAQRKQIVSIYGPVRGGMHDKEMLERSGILQRMQKGKKKLASVDQGYIKFKNKEQLSWPNAQDSKETNNFNSQIWLRHETLNGNFNSQIWLRHETLNGKMAKYGSMNQTWRHSWEQHGIAFWAVAVTIQYALNDGTAIIYKA